MIKPGLRSELALALGFVSAFPHAAPPMLGDRKIVPAFTLLSSRIDVPTPQLSRSFAEEHPRLAVLDPTFVICLGTDGRGTERKAWPDAQAAYVKSLQLDPGNTIALGALEVIDRMRGPGSPPTTILVASTLGQHIGACRSIVKAPQGEPSTPEQGTH